MPDGSTYRDHLKAVQKFSGKPQPELQVKELPVCLKHVWYWFLRLNAKRGFNGMGSPYPISMADLWFFFSLEGITPESWELELIEKFDRIAMISFAKEQEEDNKKNKEK